MLEVESEVDELGRCIYKPEALVDAVRTVTEKHRAALAEKSGWVI